MSMRVVSNVRWMFPALMLAVSVVLLSLPARAQVATLGTVAAWVNRNDGPNGSIIIQSLRTPLGPYGRWPLPPSTGEVVALWLYLDRSGVGAVAYVRNNGTAGTVRSTDFEFKPGLAATAPPPKAQPAVATVPLTNTGDALAVTCDGRFAVLAGSSSAGTPVASVDLGTEAVVNAVSFPGKLARAVAIGDDGRTVLAILDNATITNASAIRRLTFAADGALADSGEQLAFSADDYVTKVALAPGARFGVALVSAPSGARLVSFAVPGFAPKGSVPLAARTGNALVMAPAGNAVFARSGNRAIAPDVIERFAFDPATGALGAAASLAIRNVSGFTGVVYETPLAIAPEGDVLLVAEENVDGLLPAPRIALLDAGTGALKGALTVPSQGGPRTLAALPACALAFDANQSGLSGAWYEAATSGQGLMLEIFRDLAAAGTGRAQVSWFTFDTTAGGADRQRWYTLAGDVPTGPSAALTIYRNVGGNFAAPPITAAGPVGTATLRFADCTNAELAYTFADGTARTGTIPLTRLTQNVTCIAGGAAPVDADFAHSGNWFDPATSGQGITVEVNPKSQVAFLAWYTYAPAGASAGAAGQRWYTGQAAYAAGARSVPLQLYETTGGAFDASSPMPVTAAVGSATLTFASCTSATLAYTFTEGGSSGRTGTLALARVGPAPAGCAP